MMPRYAMRWKKKKMKWKPKLSLQSQVGDRDVSQFSASAHERFAAEMQQTVIKLGPTMERPIASASAAVEEVPSESSDLKLTGAP